MKYCKYGEFDREDTSQEDYEVEKTRFERCLIIAEDIISKAYPEQYADGFWELLENQIYFHNFTNDRILSAVYNAIDNIKAPLSIADIIQFGMVDAYTYEQLTDMVDKGAKLSDFEKRTINNTLFWVKKSDL